MTTTDAASDLSLRVFQEISVRRSERWHGDKPWSVADWYAAFAGEAGEFSDEALAILFEGDDNDDLATRKEWAATEAGDTLAYLVLLFDALDCDMSAKVMIQSVRTATSDGVRDLQQDPALPTVLDITEDQVRAAWQVGILALRAGDWVKKLNRHRDDVTTDRDGPYDTTRAALIGCLLSVFDQLLVTCNILGIDLAVATARKFNKVSRLQKWDDLLLPVPDGPLVLVGQQGVNGS